MTKAAARTQIAKAPAKAKFLRISSSLHESIASGST